MPKTSIGDIPGGLADADELMDVIEETGDWALLVVKFEVADVVLVSADVNGVVSVFDQTLVENCPSVLVDVP